MRADLAKLKTCQVFLNYPFDAEFTPLANAIHFAVVAGGLIPLCAQDLSTPDRPRLEMLIEAITSCNYSVHDFSRDKGEGSNNFARFNMPLEMGMSLFHAITNQRREHRCAFFVSTPHDYNQVVSDLGDLDPKCYDKDELLLVTNVYEWLRDVGQANRMFNQQATTEIKEKYKHFKIILGKLKGSGKDACPSHNEAQELMYTLCSEWGWWQWRAHPFLELEFHLCRFHGKIKVAKVSLVLLP